MIFDGAFGTELEKRGIMSKMPEMLNITNGDEIADIHRSYIEAGCDFITTNTFGANRIKMPGEDIKAVIEAVQSAKPASVKGVFIRSLTLSSTMGIGIPCVLEQAE